MRRLILALGTCLLTFTCLAASAAHADGTVGDVTVRIDPPAASIKLGESLDLQITVTNQGDTPSPPLVLHLDVTDPDRSTSVDPEDWTSTLSKKVGVVAPGDSATLDWRIQPISGGTFATYAVVISPGADDLASSNVAQVDVAEQQSLNPGGILVTAAGTPVVVGALLLLQLRLARRPRAKQTQQS
jgi:uncharacterized membrane protein